MPKKRKLADLSDCCRFCLARNDCSKDIFTEWIKPKIKDLEKCANSEIVDKLKYPKKICYVCLYKLEMWSDFKLQFLDTNRVLNSRFKVLNTLTCEAEESNKSKKSSSNFDIKRPRIDDDKSDDLSSIQDFISQAPSNILLQSAIQSSKEPHTETSSNTQNKIVDSIMEDFATDSTINTEPLQNQTGIVSDATSVSRKSGRLKKLEQREALTKRWVERKNALLAAQGEVPSESESDNGSQLSPVQKARAKANKEHEPSEKQKQKMTRALKNLEISLTEKFKIDPEYGMEERKIRLRSGNLEDDVKYEKISSPKKMLAENTQLNKKNKLPADLKDTGDKNDDSSKIQSEITCNNATYVISASLNLPDCLIDDEVSSKNNGLNIDITSQDGRNFDIMKAVQLQRVVPQENTDEYIGKDNNTDELTEKCFQIKVEGIEQDDLQLVQAELIKFISQNKDIENFLLQDTLSGNKISQEESDKAHKSLNQKLKEIVENLLQQNRQKEKMLHNMIHKSHKVLSEHFETIEKSFLFQPRVNIVRLDRKLFKQYKINNLHILEEVKRQRGLVGPLSRALGKRKKVMPKKYDDFNLSTKPDPSEYQRLPNKPVIKPVNINNLSSEISLDFSGTSDVSIVQLQKVITPEKISQPPVITKTTIPMTNVPKNALFPSLVPKTTVPLANVPANIPIISKVKKPTPGTKAAAKISSSITHLMRNSVSPTVKSVTTPPIKKSPAILKTKPSITKSQVKSLTTSPQAKSVATTPQPKTVATMSKTKIISNTPKTKITSKLLTTGPSNTPHTGEKIPNKTQLSSNESKKNHIETPFTLDQIKDAPIVITDDDEYDVLIQTSDTSEAVVFLESPISSPVPLPELTPTKSVPTQEKIISLVGAKPTIEKTTKSSAKNTEINNSSIVLIAPPENKLTAATNSKTVSEKRPSALAEFLKTPIKKVTPKESSTISKASNSIVNNTSKTSPSKTKDSPQNSPHRQRHICGICGEELYSKEEAEAHVKNHKVEPTQPINTTTKITNALLNSSQKSVTISNTPKSGKPKLMKCKRCQAIVEAVNVRTHICNSIKYNCTLCDCSFGADHLLVQHMETHVQPKNKDGRSKDKKEKLSSMDEGTKTFEQEPEDVEDEEDLENILAGKTEGYSCFVCDKVFVDEEQMKDHLQMHCEEVSEEISDKSGHQCAFCGEKFQTEESLETHVGNHLMENGDEKISMMINLEPRRSKKNVFRCEQCSECFTSSLSLAMHLPIHENEDDEEAMLMAEYARDNTEVTQEEMAIEHEEEVTMEQHVCQICDEVFDNVDDLVPHTEAHCAENPHVCILCEKSFATLKELQEHVPSHL